MHSLKDILLFTKDIDDKGLIFFNGKDEKYYSYQKFIQRSLSVLHLLSSHGINSGTSIVIQTVNPEATLLLTWACILGDIIPIPSAINYSNEQLKFLDVISKTVSNANFIFNEQYLIFLKKLAQRSGNSPRALKSINITENDVLSTSTQQASLPPNNMSSAIQQRLILFSSGTTGVPKGIIYSDENLITNIITVSNNIGISQRDSLMNWLPLNHILGLSLHFIASFNKVNQYILPTSSFLQKPNIWLEEISRRKITVSVSPNFGYELSLQSDVDANLDLSSLRLLIMGAEPTSISLISKFTIRFLKFGLLPNVISSGYGLTEAQMVTMTKVNNPIKVLFIKRDKTSIGDKVELLAKKTENCLTCVAQGNLYECFQLTITDKVGNKLPDGSIGIIHLSGPSISKFYITVDGRQDVLEKDHTFNTMDVGFTINGQLYIIGREKDMVILNGENLFLQDLDAILKRIPNFKKTAVASINVNYDDHDHIVILVDKEVLHISNQEIIEKVIYSTVSRQLQIKVEKVLFVDKILKTSTGKIMRKANYDLYSSQIIEMI